MNAVPAQQVALQHLIEPSVLVSEDSALLHKTWFESVTQLINRGKLVIVNTLMEPVQK